MLQRSGYHRAEQNVGGIRWEPLSQVRLYHRLDSVIWPHSFLGVDNWFTHRATPQNVFYFKRHIRNLFLKNVDCFGGGVIFSIMTLLDLVFNQMSLVLILLSSF